MFCGDMMFWTMWFSFLSCHSSCLLRIYVTWKCQQANSTDLVWLAIYDFATFYHWYFDILYIKEVWIAMVTTKPANITVLFCSGAGTPQKILALKSWPINHRLLFATESSLTSGNPRQRLCILKKLRLIEFLLTSLVRKLWNLRRYCMHWTAVWQWYIRRAAVRSNWCAIRTKSVTEWLHTRSYKTNDVCVQQVTGRRSVRASWNHVCARWRSISENDARHQLTYQAHAAHAGRQHCTLLLHTCIAHSGLVTKPAFLSKIR